MGTRSTSILLVESDDEVADMIIDHIERRMRARVTRVATATEALSSNMVQPHDVVLADTSLPDCSDLGLARELRGTTDSEVILITGNPTLGRAIEAMRLGVRDMFTKPFDLSRLSEAVERAAEARHQRQRERLRCERLRRVTSRILRERRSMRQRVDLVCRDLVGAYRRLAEKVVTRRDVAD